MSYAPLYSQNLTIKGNTVEEGYDLVSNITATLYTYTSAISTAASSLITGNQLSGSGTTTSAIVVISGGSSVITDNVLSRSTFELGSVAVKSYIDVANAAFDQTIKNNFFDSTTADGLSNTTLVTGLSTTSLYTGNTNQVSYAAIPITDYSMYVAPGISGQTSANQTGPSPGWPILYSDTTVGTFQIQRIAQFVSGGIISNGTGSSYLWIYDTVAEAIFGSNVKRSLSFSVPIDTSLPAGVKITSVTMGVVFSLEGSSGGATLNMSSQENNQISLTLVANTNTYTSSTQNVANILEYVQLAHVSNPVPLESSENIVSSYTVIVDNNSAGSSGPTYQVVSLNTIASATQYCTVTPIPGQFVTGAGYRIYAEVDLNYIVGNGINTLFVGSWYLSPIVIKYQW